MRCPRCKTALASPAPRCARCGAPLQLSEEPAPAPLDRALDLDRRGEAGSPPPEAGEPAVPAFDISVDAIEVHLRRAPGWRRAAAWAVDALVLGLFAWALLSLAARLAPPSAPAPETGLDWLVETALRQRVLLAALAGVVLLSGAVYAAVCHALAGATLGERLLQLRVVAADGERPSPLRATARAAVALLSVAALGLGHLLALFTHSGRTLHDLLAGTWVVEVP